MSLTDFTEEELQAELERRKAEVDQKAFLQKQFPKYVDVYVHNGKWDEQVMEWAKEECGWDKDSPQMYKLAYIAYENKLTYEVDRTGDFVLVAVNDRFLGVEFVRD